MKGHASHRTDLQRARGLGAAGDGTDHWWHQRLTAIALVPLTLLFIFPFARNLGGTFEQVRASYAHPFNAIVAILFLIVACIHFRQGVQVVIEDYVHHRGLRTAALLANILFSWAAALAGVFAVAKIAFTA